MDANDPFDLARFVIAQQHVMSEVLLELKNGRKLGHWMWFVFPQLRGLGTSAMSRTYGIASLDEAAAYLQHPILGPRLIQCTDLVIAVQDGSAEAIFGPVDALKFRSSMTLFAHLTPVNEVFRKALEKYFAGEFDPLTMNRLRPQTA